MKTVDFSETIAASDLKFSRSSHLIEYMNTLQEMCCGFLLSREMWYRKSVLPGNGAG